MQGRPKPRPLSQLKSPALRLTIAPTEAPSLPEYVGRTLSALGKPVCPQTGMAQCQTPFAEMIQAEAVLDARVEGRVRLLLEPTHNAWRAMFTGWL